MKFSFLLMLFVSIVSWNCHAESTTKDQICNLRGTFGITKSMDTGFYVSFLEISFREKFKEAYTLFYYELYDAMKTEADKFCSPESQLTGEEIVQALGVSCQEYCQENAEEYSRSTYHDSPFSYMIHKLFGSTTLPSECRKVCDHRTAENLEFLKSAE